MGLGIDKISSIGGKSRPPDKDGQSYTPVVIETYKMSKPGKRHDLHARPIKGQGKFRPEFDAECSRQMREEYPVGTMFLVWAILIDREGTEFVYTSHRWPHDIVRP